LLGSSTAQGCKKHVWAERDSKGCSTGQSKGIQDASATAAEEQEKAALKDLQGEAGTGSAVQ